MIQTTLKYAKCFLQLTAILILPVGCVQKTHLKRITFKVDMNQVEHTSQVGIRGNTAPLTWNETHYLKDVNGDGIFEDTLVFDIAQNTIQFKFVNNNGSFELDCDGNRIINLEYEPEKIIYSGVFDQADGTQKSID